MATALQLGPPVGPTTSPSGPPLLRVVTPDALNAFERDRAAAALPQQDEVVMDELARHIRTEWETMRNHRNSAVGWNDRLLHAQRVFNGKYDDSQLQAIRQ